MGAIVTSATAGGAESNFPSDSAPRKLTAEYQASPLGLGTARPRLGWQLGFRERGARQTAYEIQSAATADELVHGSRRLWDSQRVESGESVFVPYGGPALQSAQRVCWRVRTWNESGTVSGWSEPAWFETGLLAASDWKAQWIAPALPEDPTKSGPAPLLRRAFKITGPVRAARLYITSLGLYAAQLNGRDVGDQFLTPGWTDYDKRVEYQTYDVTDLVRTGDNALGVTLADGWYRGFLGYAGARNTYGRQLALLAELRVTRDDGSVQVIVTDGSWKSSTGPVRAADLYNGETYDARMEKTGWSSPDYDESGWAGVRLIERTKDTLFAGIDPPVRRTGEIRPVSARRGGNGETIFDLGQNMVGWVRLRVQGAAGSTVKLRYAEVLDRDGNLYTANLRSAQATDRYVLKGGGSPEIFEPRFTFHGFRYVGLSAEARPSALNDITGIVVGTDLEPAGTWESSNQLLNRLQQNVVWGQRGNFVSVPTDCPQRDERLGWTGDAQVFARTAAYEFNVAGFFTRWLDDVTADQKQDGAMPFVIPDVLSRHDATLESAAGWGDSAVIIPWTMYLAYGDRQLLARQYPSMRAWVEYLRRVAPHLLWNTGHQFGDWLAYAAPSDEARSHPGATTGTDLIATAFFAHSTDLLARAAHVLGHEDDARAYAALFGRIKEAFNREFVTPDGRVGESTQTAYALALEFGLLPAGLETEAVRRLAADVVRRGNHLTTGFLGTPYLCQVLGDHDHLDTAYALLLQDSYPSWLFPVRMGATTIWERWDGIKPDGAFQDPGMNSFNHYAYGSVAAWMYGVVAGIATDPDQPGYKHVLIRPRPGGGLTFVRATQQTQYGEVASSWEVRGETLALTAIVPPNTTATVRLPGAKLSDVREDDRPLAEASGITASAQDGDAVSVETGAGVYHFAYRAPDLIRTLHGQAEH
ncbi:MAG TPA: family 78 glycoside hydrolase catalytic domain [Opitutus sp.]|nr:family 78 glycoside hydrolase catalytic domain [Opitutus sp.]